jgi:uncharacterized protein
LELPLFFKNKTYNLFGVLHEPDNIDNNDTPETPFGIVFCSPFAEEKIISHRIMVNLSRQITKMGVYCFRFDYMGHGDSDGKFEDSTIETRISDIIAAIELLKKKTGVKKICLLGLRLGATLAVMTHTYSNEVDKLLLISPILKGKNYIEQCLRSNLSTQLFVYKKIVTDRKVLIDNLINGENVNIDGYMLTKTLFQQISDINLTNFKIKPVENILILQISKIKNKPVDNALKKFSDMYKYLGCNCKVINIQDQYFWADNKVYKAKSEEIQKVITSWIGQLA